MTTVYISIGTPKTGTTALQSFMRENDKLLEKQGYCYPEMKLEMPAIYRDRNAHFLILRSRKKSQEERTVHVREVRENGFKQMEELAKKFDNIVLSDEQLWYRSGQIENFWENLIRDFKKINCDVKIIVYLRRQDQVIQSLWNQLVKMSLRRTEHFKECIENGTFDYFPLDYYTELKKIEKHVGKENLIVRVYEKGQFEGEEGIFSDFFKIVGLKLTDEFTRQHVAKNVGLNGNYIEIKRIINGIPEYRELDDFMFRSILNASIYDNEGHEHAKTSMFTYEEQLAYMRQFEESNRKVAEEFLDCTDSVMFREEIKEQPVWSVNKETMDRDMLIAIAEIFCAQERKIRGLEERLRNQLNGQQSWLEQQQLQLDAQGKDVAAMHNSFIFRMYRKIRKTFKGNRVEGGSAQG